MRKDLEDVLLSVPEEGAYVIRQEQWDALQALINVGKRHMETLAVGQRVRVLLNLYDDHVEHGMGSPLYAR